MSKHPPTPRVNPAIEHFLLHPGSPLHQAGDFAQHALGTAEHVGEIVGALTLGILAVVVVVRLVARRRIGHEPRLVRIGVPPDVNQDGGQLLWSALHDLLRPPLARWLTGQPHIAWEITASQDGTSFCVWVPQAIPPGLVERAVAAAWPGASATVQDAPAPSADSDMAQATSELSLSGSGWFCLDSSMSPDPLPLILGQLSEMREREHAVIQVIARPATSREQRRLRDAATRIRRGEPTSRLLRILRLLHSAPPAPRLDPTIAPDVREAMLKSAGSLYRCAIRASVTAESRGQARGRIHAVLGAFAPYHGARVFLRRRHVSFGAHGKLRERRLGRHSFLASVPELAALAHLPTQEAIPGVLIAGAREVSAPPGLPTAGKPLGLDCNRKAIKLSVPDARRHLHLLGPTGVGKSTLIARLALADFEQGIGTVVIDPKGDLVEDILDRIPAGRESEVDLLDPLDCPPGLNVLDSEDRDLGTDQLVGIFRRVFTRFWGPRTDDILRATLLTLMSPQVSGQPCQATLADVPRLLTDRAWQAQVQRQIEDPVLSAFWEWYAELSDALRAQATGPLLNKLRAFLLRRPVRAIIAQPTTTLDVAGALDHGRLLLAKLPKGTLGEDTSRLLGSFLFARVWQGALARAATPPGERADSACYVDEVHNYLNLPTPFEDVLAEARSYRLSLGLAHQHLAQLPRELREALSANARTKVYFQLSRHDAQALEREAKPEFTAHDLSHLPAFTAAVRLCNQGEPGRAFTLRTEALPAAIDGRATQIRALLRERNEARQADAPVAAGRQAPLPEQRPNWTRPPLPAAVGDPPTDPPTDPSTDPPTD